MAHIEIISASVRAGRASHRVALYLSHYIQRETLFSIHLIDLMEYQFPLFEERLMYQQNPIPQAIDFSERIKKADVVIIVTPEYNGGYPASLKNAIDLLVKEWYHKPVALVTVSSGPFAASQVMTSLLFSLWKIGAWMIPAKFQVAKVAESYKEDGTAVNGESSDKAAASFLKEILWALTLKGSK